MASASEKKEDIKWNFVAIFVKNARGNHFTKITKITVFNSKRKEGKVNCKRRSSNTNCCVDHKKHLRLQSQLHQQL